MPNCKFCGKQLTTYAALLSPVSIRMCSFAPDKIEIEDPVEVACFGCVPKVDEKLEEKVKKLKIKVKELKNENKKLTTLSLKNPELDDDNIDDDHIPVHKFYTN